MFDFLFKKERTLETHIFKYLESFRLTQENFARAFQSCLLDSGCDKFQFYLEQTHKFESRADDIREDIKNLMYGKALIPESRGDIMGLIEALDELPGLFEDVLYAIATEQISLPAFLHQDIREMVEYSLQSVELVAQEVEALFRKNEDIMELAKVIDQNESHCDHIERRLVTSLFQSDLDPFMKLQLKDLFILLGSISDQADRVSRRIHIINIKRRV